MRIAAPPLDPAAPPSAPESPSAPTDDLPSLRARVDELTRERDQLLTVVDVMHELTSSLQVAEVLQRIARRLGELFGLDRSSIYVTGEGKQEVRLVATFENPALTNLVIDLARYPELRHAFESGQTVLIPDASTDPLLESVRDCLDLRSARSIVVVPIRWRATVIGAILLRTEHGGTPFVEGDIRFCEVIASLTAKALRNAHRFEQAQRANDEQTARHRRAELERIALVAFLRRFLSRYAHSDDHVWAETLLPRESDDELERLVSVAMQVIAEEAKGGQA